MSDQYTIARGSEQFGPYTRAQIDEYLATGSLQPTDLAWTEGMADWTPLSQLVAASPAAPGPPAPGMAPPMAAAPAAGSNNKAVITWVVRGVLIFILLGVGGVYLFVDRPAKAEMMSKFDEVSEYVGDIKELEELNKEIGKEPEKGENSDGDKTLTYTWKGVLLNYQIVILYVEIDPNSGQISIDEVSSQ